MDELVDRLRYRVVPALLTAMGVMLLTGGLLSYADPTTAGPLPSETPVEVTLEPSPSAPASPSVSTSPSPSPSDSGSPSPSVSPSVSPSPTYTLPPGTPVVATRIVIPSMKVDLPVIRGPSGYPPCNVAMYLKELGQPGESRATYLYAHARKGMFLPLLEASKVNNGRSMLGKQVQVYTNADELHVYEIFAVRRHQRTLDQAFSVTKDELWLQTSEGPDASYPKLMVVARKLSVGPADHADARPRPRPVDC
jgi:hypothetical protein